MINNLKWYEQTSEMQQNILIMLIFQKPISLSINFLMPKLSLRSYCAVKLFNSSNINYK